PPWYDHLHACGALFPAAGLGAFMAAPDGRRVERLGTGTLGPTPCVEAAFAAVVLVPIHACACALCLLIGSWGCLEVWKATMKPVRPYWVIVSIRRHLERVFDEAVG